MSWSISVDHLFCHFYLYLIQYIIHFSQWCAIMLIIIERKCTRHVLDCKLLFTHSDLQSWNWRVLCRNAPVPCSSFWTTGLQMLWLYSDLGESLKIKHCLSASSLHAKKKIWFSSLLWSVAFRKSESMYHAMGYSSILVMQAAMTFEPKDIDAAMTSLRESLQTCQRLHIFLAKEEKCSYFNVLQCHCFLYAFWLRFRKKSGFMETIATFWYGHPAETSTEGKQGDSTTVRNILNVIMN